MRRDFLFVEPHAGAGASHATGARPGQTENLCRPLKQDPRLQSHCGSARRKGFSSSRDWTCKWWCCAACRWSSKPWRQDRSTSVRRPEPFVDRRPRPRFHHHRRRHKRHEAAAIVAGKKYKSFEVRRHDGGFVFIDRRHRHRLSRGNETERTRISPRLQDPSGRRRRPAISQRSNPARSPPRRSPCHSTTPPRNWDFIASAVCSTPSRSFNRRRVRPRRSWAEKNARCMVRFMKGMVQSLRWMHNNKDATVEFLTKEIQLKPVHALKGWDTTPKTACGPTTANPTWKA